MAIHFLNRDRLRREVPAGTCGRCGYSLEGLRREGACPECGQQFGYVCKRCRYPLIGCRPAGECPECGRAFDKGRNLGVEWLGKVDLSPPTPGDWLKITIVVIVDNAHLGLCLVLLLLIVAVIAKSLEILILDAAVFCACLAAWVLDESL